MHTEGVSLVVQGLPAPNNSLVDVDDVLDIERFFNLPSNEINHYEALLCVTDLVRCCQNPRLGSWHFPNGSIVQEEQGNVFSVSTYRSSWGQHEILNHHQFYGSVRLYRRFTNSTLGGFRCELPDANNVTQTLYAILGKNNLPNTRHSNTYLLSSILLVDFVANRDRKYHPVQISLSGSNTNEGIGYSLTCSTLLLTPLVIPSDIPTPTFQWFSGPNGNGPLPAGATPSMTISSTSSNPDGILYSSTLEFPRQSQPLHTGKYTCRLGAGRLENSAIATANREQGIVINVYNNYYYYHMVYTILNVYK